MHYQQESRRYGSDCNPPLLALNDAVLDQNYVRIVERAGCGFEVQAVVLRPVDSVLPWIPFEAHRYTLCITLWAWKSTPFFPVYGRSRKAATPVASPEHSEHTFQETGGGVLA